MPCRTAFPTVCWSMVFSDVSLLIECTREEAGEAEFLYARAYLSAPEAGSMLAGMAALEEVAATGE